MSTVTISRADLIRWRDAAETCGTGAVEDGEKQWYSEREIEQAIDEMTAALAQPSQPKPITTVMGVPVYDSQPEQEPVAWRYKVDLSPHWHVSERGPEKVAEWNTIVEAQPLYTAPPQPVSEEAIREEPDVAKRLRNYENRSMSDRRAPTNPCITAREACELAKYIATLRCAAPPQQAVSEEVILRAHHAACDWAIKNDKSLEQLLVRFARAVLALQEKQR